jgi:hypothetical protein
MERMLSEHHEETVESAAASLRLRLRDTFAACLRLLYPGIEGRAAGVSDVLDLGVAGEGPG